VLFSFNVRRKIQREQGFGGFWTNGRQFHLWEVFKKRQQIKPFMEMLDGGAARERDPMGTGFQEFCDCAADIFAFGHCFIASHIVDNSAKSFQGCG